MNIKGIATIAVVIALVAGVASTALAANNSGTTKPGWGYGDTNHVHTGPPGQSVRPSH